MVYHLRGDPSAECWMRAAEAAARGQDAGSAECTSAADLNAHAYCTCRCDARDDSFSECACRSGFTCTEVTARGSPGVVGGYCVKNSSINTP